jgi:SAM-dependent methyltransferase
MAKKLTIPYEFDPGLSFPAYLTRNNLLNSIRKYAPQLRGRLMDFGCGSKPYQSLFDVSEYVGVDYASEGHPHEGEQIDVFYDGKTLPFPDNHFDSVFSAEVFEHIFNLSEILPEIRRVMKPGAKILVTCPFAIVEHEVPNDYARYTSFALKHLFNNAGFKVLDYEKAGNHIETIMQLRIMYWHLHILPVVRKIPIVRSGLRLLIFSGLNIWAKLKSAVLPDQRDLYLNNIILCEKN